MCSVNRSAISPNHAHSSRPTLWPLTCTNLIGQLRGSVVNQYRSPKLFFRPTTGSSVFVSLNHLSSKFHTRRTAGLLALVNKHTHAYFMDYSPLLSLVVLAVSLVLGLSASRSSIPGSDWDDNWQCGKVWSSERLFPKRQNDKKNFTDWKSLYFACKLLVPLKLLSQKDTILPLTSTLCGGDGGTDGGSGGSGPQRCSCFIKEVCTGTCLVLLPLVLVQPLVQDLDHSVLFQDLSIKSTDPGK